MKTVNEKKICFIICTNKDRKLQECLLYIDLLTVPEGFETEVLTVCDAESMAKGYNEAMNASDARYKVYLHQDVFIFEKDFIEKFLKIFSADKKIGMIGMVGTSNLSKDGIIWHSERCGNVYVSDVSGKNSQIEPISKGVREVEALDGFLMITCQDIPWRDDILDGWDFCEISQCLEFKRAGYKIVVPQQNPAWVIHDCGPRPIRNYETDRQKLLTEYADIFSTKKELRILFFHSNKCHIFGLPMGLMELGHKVDIPNYLVDLVRYSEADKAYVTELLEEGHYDLVVTYDFSLGVSEACKEVGINYLAWIYDSPLMQLYTKQALNECNYISVFDRKQKERLEELGFPHLYYYPLAAEVDAFGSVVISKADEKEYGAEISFVGNLYDQGEYEKVFEHASEEIKKDAEAAANSTKCVWDGKNSIFGKISDNTIQYMSECQKKEIWETYNMEKGYFNEAVIISRKANETERVTILNKLAERHEVVLYTGSKQVQALKNVKVCSKVDYLTGMPKVFYLSKINLNITSRSIESGLSQRIWDVMGVGGFLLTNYQPEIEEYFEVGKDLEVFHDLDELMEKADYYLTHEDIRLRIALNGYKKIRKYHKYSNRLDQMLKEML